MTESRSVIYRVIPKCACSTIGQIMYYGDHGAYYDGDIHDATSGLHKWGLPASQEVIAETVRAQNVLAFTCVRNPWTRLLSAFFDKIAGIQRNGKRYRAKEVPGHVARYGIQVDGEFDQIRMFRRFCLFARDTIRFGKPMGPDIHWTSMAGHASTFVVNGGRYDMIITTEDFAAGMKAVLARIEQKYPVDIDTMPRFNESAGHGPKRLHPVADYFDDLTIHLVHEIYRRDFNLFKYGRDPYAGPPAKEIDLDEVNAKLAR